MGGVSGGDRMGAYNFPDLGCIILLLNEIKNTEALSRLLYRFFVTVHQVAS